MAINLLRLVFLYVYLFFQVERVQILLNSLYIVTFTEAFCLSNMADSNLLLLFNIMCKINPYPLQTTENICVFTWLTMLCSKLCIDSKLSNCFSVCIPTSIIYTKLPDLCSVSKTGSYIVATITDQKFMKLDRSSRADCLNHKESISYEGHSICIWIPK